VVLKVTKTSLHPFVYGAVTLFGRPFQERSTKNEVCNSLTELQLYRLGLTTPTSYKLAGH
jgi:hypothetical protein